MGRVITYTPPIKPKADEGGIHVVEILFKNGSYAYAEVVTWIVEYDPKTKSIQALTWDHPKDARARLEYVDLTNVDAIVLRPGRLPER